MSNILPKYSFTIIVLLSAAFIYVHSNEGYYYPPPGETESFQSKKEPSQVGMSHKIHNFRGPALWTLWRHGYLVRVQGSFNTKWEVKSARKTVHAALAGASLYQNKFPGINQKISVWNKELKGNDAEATWWHVLTQTSGFRSGNKKPGEQWQYQDPNAHNICRALARIWGFDDYSANNWIEVSNNSFFKDIGMRGWTASKRSDGIRYTFDMEDLGRFGLLMLSRGQWNGKRLIDQSYIEAMETKQTYGIHPKYSPKRSFTIKEFPDAPYGYFTWVNTDGDLWKDCDKAWAAAFGAGGTFIAWNRNNGIVVVGKGLSSSDLTSWSRLFKEIEKSITGANPLVNHQTHVNSIIWRTGSPKALIRTNHISMQWYNIMGEIKMDPRIQSLTNFDWLKAGRLDLLYSCPF